MPSPARVMVFDSLAQSVHIYTENSIFRNLRRLARMLYGDEAEVEVWENYPQQSNCVDCGMFLLMGARDILSGKEWSFQQGDIRFKRVQVALEIYHLTIMGTPAMAPE